LEEIYLTQPDYRLIYDGFHAPLTDLDCGMRCGVYNAGGAPFCCDTGHCVPSADVEEWAYLEKSTDLWHLYQAPPHLMVELSARLPDGQVLIECLGYEACQRSFRAIACRAFPFFPYITRQGEFIGMSYYWEYEDRCWVISHLSRVTAKYRQEFYETFDKIFQLFPDERESFRYQSTLMRRVFGRRHLSITVLHRNGCDYKLTPRNGRLRRVSSQVFPQFEVYKIADALPFPGEE
jgi:hypothetical protein